MKIRSKNRRWILHYHRLGGGHENFADPWPDGDESAVQAFALRESTGRVVGCSSPATMCRLTAGKKLHGINVDGWAKGWAECLFSAAEIKEYCNDVDGLYEEVYRVKWMKYA